MRFVIDESFHSELCGCRHAGGTALALTFHLQSQRIHLLCLRTLPVNTNIIITESEDRVV